MVGVSKSEVVAPLDQEELAPAIPCNCIVCDTSDLKDCENCYGSGTVLVCAGGGETDRIECQECEGRGEVWDEFADEQRGGSRKGESMFTSADLVSVFSQKTDRPLTDFEKLVEQAAIAAAKALDAATEIETSRRVLEETLQRVGDAEHPDMTAKAATIAIWRATLEQLKRASEVMSGAV